VKINEHKKGSGQAPPPHSPEKMFSNFVLESKMSKIGHGHDPTKNSCQTNLYIGTVKLFERVAKYFHGKKC
jgi:hypothetical protein